MRKVETITLDTARRLYQPDGISLSDRVELARLIQSVVPAIKDEPDVANMPVRGST